MNINNVIYWFLIIGLSGAIARWWVDLVRWIVREIKILLMTKTVMTNAADRKQLSKAIGEGTLQEAVLAVLRRHGIMVTAGSVAYDDQTHILTVKP